jgi:hypothetical protein
VSVPTVEETKTSFEPYTHLCAATFPRNPRALLDENDITDCVAIQKQLELSAQTTSSIHTHPAFGRKYEAMVDLRLLL